jgi:hypothetical protein
MKICFLSFLLMLHAITIGTHHPLLRSLPIRHPCTTAELHDKKHQPDLENGRQMGMPLDEFTDELWAGLSAGKEDIPVGMGKAIWERIEPGRREEAGKFP